MKTTRIIAIIVISCYLPLTLPAAFGETQNLLEAWNNIKTNYANDIEQSNNIYKKLKEEQHALGELRTIVERHLRTKNAELIANAIGSNQGSLTETGLKEIIKNITQNYEQKMVEGILSQAMDEILLMRPLSEMPQMLMSIYELGDMESFEQMLLLQIQLYSSSNAHHHNDEREFLQKFAYILYKIVNDPLYKILNLKIKSSVQSVVEKLPNNLRYLYFTPYFCLVNEKYSTYIYAAIEAKVDAVSRYIWLWYDNKSMDDTGFIKAEVTKNKSQYKVALKSTKYQLYYYMMPSSKKIAGWESNSTPTNHIWTIDFIDNERVAFSQDDYLMCAVELHDNERRNVGGRKKGEVYTTTPDCQWRLGACSFK